MYADDSLIYVFHKDVNVIEKKLNEELQNLGNRLVNNLMKVNVNKTKVYLEHLPKPVKLVMFKYTGIICYLL